MSKYISKKELSLYNKVLSEMKNILEKGKVTSAELSRDTYGREIEIKIRVKE
jgi:hypothetical protein